EDGPVAARIEPRLGHVESRTVSLVDQAASDEPGGPSLESGDVGIFGAGSGRRHVAPGTWAPERAEQSPRNRAADCEPGPGAARAAYAALNRIATHPIRSVYILIA